MSGVATAIGGAAVLGAGAQIIGSQNAASAEKDAANAAAQTQMAMFNTQQANEKPYMDAGKDALGQIQANMPKWNTPFSMSDFHEDPGYQFDLQQGQKSIQDSNAARSGLVSGAQLAALNNYSQNMASNEYQNAYNRYNTNIQGAYQRLSGVASLGQSAASGANNAAQNAGNNISAAQIGAGNAAAAGSTALASGISNALTGGANAFGNYTTMSNLYSQPGASGIQPGSLNASQSFSMPQVGSQYAAPASNYLGEYSSQLDALK